MLKKILIAVAIVLMAGGAFTVYGTYKVANLVIDENLKEHEPQLRQYVQMNEAQQNEYILTNANEIITASLADAQPKDKEGMEALNRTKDDPIVQKAIINLGRSVMAKGILRLDTLAKDMSPEIKAKYQKESDSLKDNFMAYCKVAEEADARIQTAS